MKLDPNKIYVGSELYLPFSSFNSDFIELSLTLSEGRKKTKLFKKIKTHIIVPRYYLTREELNESECEVIYLPRTEFPKIEFFHNITLRSNQEEAWNRFKDSDCGILNLAPGKGKTVLSLLKIAKEGVPALVSVNTTSLIDQWKEFIEKFLGIKDVGIIGDKKFDWKKSITIATIQSLVSLVDDNKVPEGFENHFGQYFVDEGHHIGGKKFCLTAQLCKGNKFILSANEKRTDGAERYIKYYFGDTIYSDRTYDLIPEIRIIRIDGDTLEEGHTEKVISDLGKNKKANLLKAKYIKELSKERKSILVSTRVDQLKDMGSWFPGSVVITREVPKEDRLPLIRNSNLSFIIDNFGIEALDCPELDTLFMLLPVPADIKTMPDGTKQLLGNNLIQIMGRILRVCDKQSPLVIIFDDVNVPAAHGQVIQLMRCLDIHGFRYEYI